MANREADLTPVGTRRSRRWTTRAGIVLVVVGVGLLGWVGWQLWGTNYVAHRTQDRITSDLRRSWEEGGRGTVRVHAGEEEITATAVVRIPRFGDDYEVPVVEGTSDEALASGLAHDPRTATVGAVGNYVLAGHRVTHGEPLRNMPELRSGDRVVVETRDATYTYVLDTGGDDLTVPFTDTWVTEPRPRNPDGGVQPASGQDALLTLVTCSELFHTDGRLVAFGHLASVDKT